MLGMKEKAGAQLFDLYAFIVINSSKFLLSFSIKMIIIPLTLNTRNFVEKRSTTIFKKICDPTKHPQGRGMLFISRAYS